MEEGDGIHCVGKGRVEVFQEEKCSDFDLMTDMDHRVGNLVPKHRYSRNTSISCSGD